MGLAAVAACQPVETGERAAAVVGGTVDLGDPAVVALQRCRGASCSACTASLVGTQTVLSAAHCVDDYLDDVAGTLSIFFGTNVEDTGTFVAVDDAGVHRYYDAESLRYDVAMLHMVEPAPAGVDPVALRERPLDDGVIGAEIRMVGYGETEFERGDFGVKHQVVADITALAPEIVFTGSDTANTCNGDSGGPTFFDDGSGEEQIGITSRSRACGESSSKIRVDVFVEEMIYPYIDRFEGACAADGSCQTGCPRTPDPDCDPCGWNGVCGEDCAEPDWDCPVGILVGGSCDDDAACERGQCVDAIDDPRVRYCSQPCEPGGDAALACTAGMVCDGGQCAWPAPTPRALGSGCATGNDCRSGLCEAQVCVELCDDVAGGSCASPFECRASDVAPDPVCGPALDPGDGGCGCRTSQGAGAWLAAAALALVALRRRRRR